MLPLTERERIVMLSLTRREGIVMLSLIVRNRYEMKISSLWTVDESVSTVTNHIMRLYKFHAFPHKPVKNIHASPDGEGRNSHAFPDGEG